MYVKNLHQKISLLSQHVPVIAMPHDIWQMQLEKFSAEYFKKYNLPDQETPLNGIVADFENQASHGNLTVVHNKYDEIKVVNYSVNFLLKVKGLPGYLSRHVITFNDLTFRVISQEGTVKLVREHENYTIASSLGTAAERQEHINRLLSDHGYTQDQIDYFTERQEPAAGFLLADSLIERFNTPFEIINLNKLFSRIGFSGEFTINDLRFTNDQTEAEEKVICFIAEKFVKKPPTQCEIEEQYNSTYSGGRTDVNGDLQFSAGTPPAIRTGKKPRHNTGETGEIYLFLPEEASQQLFTFNNPLSPKTTLALTRGSFDLPPFYIDHKTEFFTDKQVEFEWNELDPIIHLKAEVNLNFYLRAFVKIFRIKKHIGTVDVSKKYTLEYKGKMMELANGDLAFVGELYDPSNFSIERFKFNSILPEFIDSIISKVVKYIFEPILRLLVTAVIMYVTWPFMENYIMNAFINEGVNWGRSRLPKTKLSNYYSDKKSAIFGVKAFIEDVG